MATAIQFIPLASVIAIAGIAFIFCQQERNRRVAVESRFHNVVDADREADRVIREARQAASEIEVAAEREATRAIAESKQTASEIVASANDQVARILDEAEDAAKRCELRAEEAENRLETLRQDIATLQRAYATKKQTYDQLAAEVAIFDERLAFAEMGVYEPHFDFTDSEQFKAAIVEVREAQKAKVSAGSAVVCRTEWSVDGSRSKGKTMTGRNIRLTLRAFNNECDAAIANTRWNNANAMEKRIIRAKEQIDKLNESNQITITSDYLTLKLRELRLTHECREKLKQEREERTEMARLAREEQRLLREMEEAQRDQEHYEKLLAKAKVEAASVAGQKLEAFSEQIRLLERDLAEAQAKAARAQALAEKTSSGYVYIISNVGSFGEDVVKIGLTRRLDPLDRVKELGDASVPFVFDTHAIIYSDNAPALERALHAEFEAFRINTQNFRKEFFRVSLRDVEEAMGRLAPEAPFFRDIEAQEYRETLARRQAALETSNARVAELFPASI